MRRYFSFFGILMATSNAKFNLFLAKVNSILNLLPKIKKELEKTLFIEKQSSTNSL